MGAANCPAPIPLSGSVVCGFEGVSLGGGGVAKSPGGSETYLRPDPLALTGPKPLRVEFWLVSVLAAVVADRTVCTTGRDGTEEVEVEVMGLENASPEAAPRDRLCGWLRSLPLALPHDAGSLRLSRYSELELACRRRRVPLADLIEPPPPALGISTLR